MLPITNVLNYQNIIFYLIRSWIRILKLSAGNNTYHLLCMGCDKSKFKCLSCRLALQVLSMQELTWNGKTSMPPSGSSQRRWNVNQESALPTEAGRTASLCRCCKGRMLTSQTLKIMLNVEGREQQDMANRGRSLQGQLEIIFFKVYWW